MAGNLAGGEQRAIHHSPWCVLAVAGLPSGNRDLGFRLLRGTVYGDRAVDAGISGSARPGPVAHIHLLPQCSLAREAEAKLCASAPVDVTKDTGTEDVVSVPPHCWQAGPPFAPPQSASTHQGNIIVEIRPCAPGAQPLLGRRNRLQPPSPCPRRRKLRRLQPCCPGAQPLLANAETSPSSGKDGEKTPEIPSLREPAARNGARRRARLPHGAEISRHRQQRR